MRKQTLQDLYELHRKVNPKEVLIGWYSTWMGGRSGAAAAAAQQQQQQHAPAAAAEHSVDDQFTVVVHEFFSDVAGPGLRPQGLIHLLVDVSLATPHVNIFAYRPISNALLKQCVARGGAGGPKPHCLPALSPRPTAFSPHTRAHPPPLPFLAPKGCPW